MCPRCKERPKDAGSYCKPCYNAYRRERYARGVPAELRRSIRGQVKLKTRPFVRGRSTEAMRKWRAENPERNRVARQADKHRRRGARSDPMWLLILSRDPCGYCGGPSDSIDHIDPLIDGGGDGTERNLTASCRPCNSSKGTKRLIFYLLGKEV